jgi:hypothetical protein
LHDPRADASLALVFIRERLASFWRAGSQSKSRSRRFVNFAREGAAATFKFARPAQPVVQRRIEVESWKNTHEIR